MSETPKKFTGKPHGKWGKIDAVLRPHVEAMLALYIEGLSMRQIVEQLRLNVSAASARSYLSTQHAEEYDRAMVERAHEMVERNAEDAALASANGDSSGLKTAIETRFKLAALYAPDAYGDKKRVELTGKDGGSIKLEALSDDALLKIAAQGAAE